MAQTVKKLSSQRSDKGLWIYRSKTNVFDSRKARIVSKEITGAVFQRWDVLMANSVSVNIKCKASSQPEGWSSDWNKSGCVALWTESEE